MLQTDQFLDTADSSYHNNNMKQTSEPKAALFDLDGVIIDTENQYTAFWDMIGRQYLGEIDFGHKIKGTTLPFIYSTYFQYMKEKQPEITAALDTFESQMQMDFIPGFQTFFNILRSHGWKTAIVTSSNQAKMASVYPKRPELKQMFDRILTAECFTQSKPHPDPYQKGAAALNVPINRCIVFEDSINGLKSGQAAGMKVVGLTTTNSYKTVQPFAHLIISDFTQADIHTVEALLM